MLKYLKISLFGIGLMLSSSLVPPYVFASNARDNNVRTYYVDPAGNDSNNGLSVSTPWRSIEKINSSTFSPGDFILFKSGAVFNGSIHIKQSGAAGAPITFGAYGTGSKPVISGFNTLSGWRRVRRGVWEADCPGVGPNVNLVTLNDRLQGMGRYPNADAGNGGYLTFQSHVGNNTIISSDLNGSTNWTGAEVVIRKTNFLLDRGMILQQNGNNIVYKPLDATHSFYDGYGYFIQNDPRTLDEPGEWYFNPQTKTLQMYFGASGPQNAKVNVGVTGTLVNLAVNNYIVFKDIAFDGGDTYAFHIEKSSNVTIADCSITNSGRYGIHANNSPNLVVEHNTIDQTQDVGIYCSVCSSSRISNNVVTNTGLIPGAGTQYVGIFCIGDSALVEENRIVNTGYNGLQLYGNYAIAKNNFIDNFTTVLDDGAGIFMSGPAYRGRQIIGNIIINGKGATVGEKHSFVVLSEGIYVDDNTSDIVIADNSVSNVAGDGIKVHNAHNITVKNNTLFGNSNQLLLDNDTNPNGGPIRNVTVTDNILYAKKIGQTTLQLQDVRDDIGQFGTFDRNHFAQSFKGKPSIVAQVQNRSARNYDLKTWASQSNNDAHSTEQSFGLSSYNIGHLSTPNLFPNGNFNSNLQGVTSYSKNNDLKIAWSSSGQLDGGALQVNVVNTNGNPDYNLVTMDVGRLSGHSNYVLHFSLVGNSGADGEGLSIYLRKAGPPYTPLTDQQVVNVSGTRTDHELIFTPFEDEDDAIISFIVYAKQQSSSFWIDNVSLHQTNVDLNSSGSSVKFVYNETNQTKNIDLDGSYQDVKGVVSTNRISLPPHSSAILTKMPN